MKKLIKTISGHSCEVYGIFHHNRLLMGKSVPQIEIYENSVEVPTIGTNKIHCKHTTLSICICPNPETNMDMTDEKLNGLTAFDLSMLLHRKDGVVVPFELYGISSAELSPEQWVFEVTDKETVKKLLAL